MQKWCLAPFWQDTPRRVKDQEFSRENVAWKQDLESCVIHALAALLIAQIVISSFQFMISVTFLNLSPLA